MSRFNKVSFIFIVVVASFLLVFVVETKFRKISQMIPWNRPFVQNVLNASQPPTEITDTRHTLCVPFKGRLGNEMFIYASAYGIARTKNRTLIAVNNPLLKVFEGIPRDDDLSKCRGLPPHQEQRSCAFDHKTMEFSDDRNVFLDGYLQSWMYFKEYSADIRRIFTFRRPILSKAENILGDIKRLYLDESGVQERNLTIIGIHVRRGDMVNEDLMKVGYRTATLKYFFRAMDYFKRRFNDTLFVICSNDIPWCRKNLQLNKNTKIASGGSPSVDMAILSLCNHTISSCGSFSWWSAWLAGGETTYFTYPAAEGSLLRKSFSENFTDYFWPSWIPLS